MKNRNLNENKNNVLVLNSGYDALNICTVNRAYKLIVKGRAEIIQEDSVPLYTSSRAYPRPSVIRLINNVSFYKKISVTRNNIFKRDEFRCGYCTSKDNLTVDHIKPKSKGGGYTWENLVTCCRRCNNKKDDKTPEEAGMKLLIKPYKPNLRDFLRNYTTTINSAWEAYLP